SPTKLLIRLNSNTTSGSLEESSGEMNKQKMTSKEKITEESTRTVSEDSDILLIDDYIPVNPYLNTSFDRSQLPTDLPSLLKIPAPSYIFLWEDKIFPISALESLVRVGTDVAQLWLTTQGTPHTLTEND